MIGGSSLGIGMTMFLRDQFSGPAARVKNSARDLNMQMRKMQEDQLRYQRNLNMGLAFGGAMAIRGMGRQIKKAADYAYEMEFVKSITAAVDTEQQKLMKTAETLAGKTMFFPQDIAEGMRFMAMAGMDAEQVLANITGAVNLAGATMTTLGSKGGAADIMTNVMKQFGVDFKYTVDVADRLAYGVTRANTNLFDLGEALKYSGATAMDLNVSLEESIAMVMALGNAGMQGSMAGVAMENSMRYMARAFSSFGSGPSQKALAEIGLTVQDVTDQAGNLLTMTEVMTKMGYAIDKHFGTGMNLEKQGVLQSIFGVRGKRAGSLFLRNLKEFQRFSSDVATQSAGHSGRIMEDMMSTLKGEFLKLGSEFKSMWIAFTTAISPTLIFITKILRVITKAMSFISKVPFLGETLAMGISGFIVLKTIGFAYKAIAAGIRLLHLQAGASAVTMGAQGAAAYNAMTAAAARYGGVSRAAMMGIPFTRGMGRYGYHPTGLFGKGGYGVRGKGGGMMMFGSAGKAAAAARKTYGIRAMGAKGMMNLGRIAAGTGGRAALAGGVARLVGLFGGPLGMALAFGIPALIGVTTKVVSTIRENKSATEANSKALKANSDSMRGGAEISRMQHAIRFFDSTYPILKLMGTTGMGVSRNVTDRAINLSDELKNLIQSGAGMQPMIVNVNLDGETIFSEQINNQLQKQSDYQERNIGLK